MVPFLAQLGLEVIPSSTNFILFRFDPVVGPSAQEASDFFAEQNILLRTMDPYGLGDCLRMSIGTDEEMAVVKEAFLRLMQPAHSR